jgi:hypothetical protein
VLISTKIILLFLLRLKSQPSFVPYMSNTVQMMETHNIYRSESSSPSYLLERLL